MSGANLRARQPLRRMVAWNGYGTLSITAAAWGAAGRAKAVEKFDTAASAQRMKHLYEELIEEKNAPRHN